MSSSARRSDFKRNCFNHTEKRRSYATNLRKNKRTQKILAKRRKQNPKNSDGSLPFDTPSETNVVAALSRLRYAINTSDVSPTDALKYLRRSLSLTDLSDDFISLAVANDACRLFGEIIGANLSSSTAQTSKRIFEDNDIYEALWCLGNIASGTKEQAKHVLPALPVVCQFLLSNNILLQEQATWVVGNVSADDSWRAQLHAAGVIESVSNLLNGLTSEIIKTAAWSISNLARGRHTPVEPFFNSKCSTKLIQLLKRKIINPNSTLNVSTARTDSNHNMMFDTPVIEEALWALSYLSARNNTFTQKLLDDGFLSGLFGILVDIDMTSTLKICTPLFRCFGNILAGPNSWVDVVLFGHESRNTIVRGNLSIFVKNVFRVLKVHIENRSVTKEICWVLSNISSGTPHHCEALFSEPGLVEQLIAIFLDSGFDVRKEAGTVILGIAAASNISFQKIYSKDILVSFLRFSEAPDYDGKKLCLNYVDLVLSHVEEANAIELLELIQYGTDRCLSKHAQWLVDTYFGEDYDDGEEEYSMDHSIDETLKKPSFQNAVTHGTFLPFGDNKKHSDNKPRPSVTPAWMNHQENNPPISLEKNVLDEKSRNIHENNTLEPLPGQQSLFDFGFTSDKR